MKQLIIIHGWTRFPDNAAFYKYLREKEYNPFEERKDRKDRLAVQLKDMYQIIKPTMPDSRNASYQARKIRFEKILPYLNDEGVILIGNSLWWNFLLKYLCENGFPVKISKLYLVCAVIDETDRWPDREYMWDFAFDTTRIQQIETLANEIYIYHS